MRPAEQLIRCTHRQQARHPEAAALRPVMIHAQLVRRDQLPRMKALNMTGVVLHRALLVLG